MSGNEEEGANPIARWAAVTRGTDSTDDSTAVRRVVAYGRAFDGDKNSPHDSTDVRRVVAYGRKFDGTPI